MNQYETERSYDEGTISLKIEAYGDQDSTDTISMLAHDVPSVALPQSRSAVNPSTFEHASHQDLNMADTDITDQMNSTTSAVINQMLTPDGTQNLRRKRNTRMNEKQRQLLLGFLEEHRELANTGGSADSGQTLIDRRSKWEVLTAMLNAVPNGSKKSREDWAKCWRDLKSKARIRNYMIIEENRIVGEGGRKLPPLSDIETRIVALVKKGPRRYFERLRDLSPVSKVVIQQSCERTVSLAMDQQDGSTRLSACTLPISSSKELMNPTKTASAEVDRNISHTQTHQPSTTVQASDLNNSLRRTGSTDANHKKTQPSGGRHTEARENGVKPPCRPHHEGAGCSAMAEAIRESNDRLRQSVVESSAAIQSQLGALTAAVLHSNAAIGGQLAELTSAVRSLVAAVTRSGHSLQGNSTT